MQPEIQSKQQAALERNEGWRVWWQLMRPHTLTASFVPVILGTVLAYELLDRIHVGLFLAMLIASILIQAATNMFNEYYDYKRGLDTEESVGIGGTIVRDGVQPKVIMQLSLLFITISILLGVYICANSSWWIAVVGLISILVGYLYTGGPLPISSTPFGEIMSGLFMGINIILISFFIQTGTITTTSILVSIPTTILIGVINLSNNIRDVKGDKEFGRKTLPVLLGRDRALKIMAGSFIVSYLWIIGLVIFNNLTPLLLIVFLSTPKAYKAVKGFIGKSEPIEMMPAMKATAQTNTIFGFLLSIGFIISFIF
ncbi:1,4-dihydroxy-2-naphthoate polyprenyltransferase [Pallidibacillus pasinlerensis]|uniref:1,4-dihydroxy-2-naphthoate octaprenyltransferase n=1 Tax=Pallidibacillus pasinlerensis TaxID=2703818 RepID=A0ABX0A8J8_9BACI|nr:1,4-dihydroxy-2-naphthoate polyprenyltransferase [Pallidibacillus pasinlerensis]NCU17785.1 1,4-dihydroxy-2-naphthoate polyprenyltransferase [Pallidibacillus pasinlerensis]